MFVNEAARTNQADETNNLTSNSTPIPLTIDSNIQFRNVTFDRTGPEGIAQVSLRILGATNVDVVNDVFKGGGDATAFEDVDGAVLNNDTVIGSTTYGFDNFDGPKDTTVENSTIYAAANSGVAMTASPVAFTPGVVASNNAVVNNNIYGTDRYGVDVDTIADYDLVQGSFVSGNLIVGVGNGIQALGNTTQTLIIGNTVAGTVVGATSAPDAYGTSIQAGPQDTTTPIADLATTTTPAPNGSRNTATLITVADNTIDAGTLTNSSQSLLYVVSPSGTVANNVFTDDTAASLSYIPEGVGGSGTTTVTTSTAPVPAGATTIVGPAAGAVLTEASNTIFSLMDASENAATLAFLVEGATGSGMPGTTSVLCSSNDTGTLGKGNIAVVAAGDSLTGAGYDTFDVSAAAAIGTTIDGGIINGKTTSQVIGTNAAANGKFVMPGTFTNIAAIKLETTDPAVSELDLNGTFDLQAYAIDAPVTIVAGGDHQTIHLGIGKDVVVGYGDGTTTISGDYSDFAASTFAENDKTYVNPETVDLFKNLSKGDTIEIPNVASSSDGVTGIYGLQFGVYHEVTSTGVDTFVQTGDGRVGPVFRVSGAYAASDFTETLGQATSAGSGAQFTLNTTNALVQAYGATTMTDVATLDTTTTFYGTKNDFYRAGTSADQDANDINIPSLKVGDTIYVTDLLTTAAYGFDVIAAGNDSIIRINDTVGGVHLRLNGHTLPACLQVRLRLTPWSAHRSMTG